MPKPKFDRLWIVEGNAGRYVKVIKQGREWLYLEPLYRWDKPRVHAIALRSEPAKIEEWHGNKSAVAFKSELDWKLHVTRMAYWNALREFFERNRWSIPNRMELIDLETAAKALGIEVENG